jgi:hypothetical protein
MTKTTREIYMEKALHARAGARDGFHVAVHCEDLIALLEDAAEYERLAANYVRMTAGSARWHVANTLEQAGVVVMEVGFARRPPRAEAQPLSIRVMRPAEEPPAAWIHTLTEVLRRAAHVEESPEPPA